MCKLDFQRDLTNIVRRYLSQNCIANFDGNNAADFAARYCEMRIRHIDPTPRHVHFSNELNDTLGVLARETDLQEREKKLEAWNTVFRLWHIFTSGGDLTRYLSKGIKDAKSRDGLLWDYGMHHFHLSRGVEKSGFIRRSDYLLFAIVADDDAFFVDVRRHRDPQGLQWVRQDLLRIVSTNWPEITTARVLRGVRGSTLTDEEKKTLRRKCTNVVVDLDGSGTAPLGWGTMADGGSAWCRLWAIKLLRGIAWHERILNDHPEELRAALAEKGVTVSKPVDLRLVLLNNLDTPPELVEYLQEGDHLSKSLYAAGFAIVEATSGAPVMITQTDEL